MKQTLRIILFVALAATLAATGCSKGGGGKTTVNLSTPKDTMKTFLGAMRAGDKEAFLACCKVEGDAKEFMAPMFEMASGSLRLSEAIEKTYGADGLKKFIEASSSGGGKSSFPTSEELDVEKFDIKVDGDKAVCRVPGNDEPQTLVKVGDKWLIDPDIDMPTDPQQKAAALKMAGLFSAPIQKTMAKVGKSGETPETLAKAFQTDMQAAMAEMMKEAFKQMGNQGN